MFVFVWINVSGLLCFSSQDRKTEETETRRRTGIFLYLKFFWHFSCNQRWIKADLRMSVGQTLRTLSGFVLVASRSLSALCVSMWKRRWHWFTAIKTQKQICGSGPSEAYWHIHSDGEIVDVCVCFRKVQLIWQPWRTTGMRGQGYRWHLQGLKVFVHGCVCIGVHDRCGHVHDPVQQRVNLMNEKQLKKHWTFQCRLQQIRVPWSSNQQFLLSN